MTIERPSRHPDGAGSPITDVSRRKRNEGRAKPWPRGVPANVNRAVHLVGTIDCCCCVRTAVSWVQRTGCGCGNCTPSQYAVPVESSTSGPRCPHARHTHTLSRSHWLGRDEFPAVT
eukprot:2603004-Prymnesium_polylepis.1